MFNRQLIFRAVVSRIRRQQQSEDDGELKDPLPDKLRSSVVCNVSLLLNCCKITCDNNETVALQYAVYMLLYFVSCGCKYEVY